MTISSRGFLERAISQGAGRTSADVVVKSVRVLDVITGSIAETDIAICGDRIVGTHDEYRGDVEIDGRGLFAVPGFVDTHVHVESSLVTPHEFDAMVLRHGVTTAICDPHEIANVLGADGIRYFLEASLETAFDLRVQLSSCVPATPFETAGARLEASDLMRFRGHPKVIGLAEFMNFPGVVHADSGCIDKLEAFADRHIDGHAPLLTGKSLNAYIAAGIRTEHEATSEREAREKLKKGLAVLIREGSVSKDLHALAPIISADTSAFLGFCTDDRNPLDIAEEGHLDFVIRTAIKLGAPLHHVYRVASWSGANAFGLRDRGLIAPGRRADIALLDDLEHCAVRSVIAGGDLVDAALLGTRAPPAPVGLDSVKLARVSPEDFRMRAATGSTLVIGVIPGKIITERLSASLPIRGTELLPDPEQDIIKVAVVARHGKNRNIGRSFVKGFGLKAGAIASSVGHDSHNITVVGVSDADMAVAVNRVAELQGGFVVAEGGSVKAEIALPMAGLMSLLPFAEVRAILPILRQAAKSLGCTLPEPFLQVAFLSLPVIPHLKITDLGLFDVDRFELVSSG